MILTIFQIALRSLVMHTKRTLFLGGAIAAVTALLVLLVGLSTGVRQTMLRSATTLMTGHLNVGGFFKVTAGQAAPVVTEYKKVLAVARAASPEITYAVQRGRGWAKLISDTGSMQVGIGGIDVKSEKEFKEVVRLSSGSMDDLEKPGTILIFDAMAKKLDVAVGDALTISAPTTRGINNTIDVRVVAIAREIGLLSRWNTYIPDVTLRALYQLNEGATGALQLFVNDMSAIPAVQAKLVSAFEKAGYRVMDHEPQPFWMKFEKVNREDWTGQKLDVTTWEDELAFMTWVLKTLDALTAILIGILMVIVVIGIMNTMWIAIRERTREIGTLRAIGMQRGRVTWMFLTEALLLGLIGTTAGAVTGALVATGLNALHIGVPISVQLFLMNDHLWLALQGASTLRAVLLITLFTTLSAIYPALRAAQLRPVTAMHHIG